VADGPDGGRPRVFCIGLNKTATTSFHTAMTMLGYNSLHWGGPEPRLAVEAAAAAGEPLLSGLDASIDAFSDIQALSERFVLLDQQYPGSRFMLTVRPRDRWVESRRRHVENNIARRDAGTYHGNFLEIDESAWIALWDSHLHAVRSYFATRTNFVETDLTAGNGWAPFCALLDIEEPQEPFPWVNRTAS
jgi:hypothetical protein